MDAATPWMRNYHTTHKLYTAAQRQLRGNHSITMRTLSARTVVLFSLAIALLAFFLKLLAPVFLREFVLKSAIRTNRYLSRDDIPQTCPALSALIRHPSVIDLDYENLRGVWYNFASNEPTQPRGNCRCNRFQWKKDEKRTGMFEVYLNTYCKPPFPSEYRMPIRMRLSGHLNETGTKAAMLEGAPGFGADYIDNYILYLDDHLTVRYLCRHDYLGVPLFQSLQIWTRQPVVDDPHRQAEILQLAHGLVPFNKEYLDFTAHDEQCERVLPPL
eukprot:scaffold2476_cov193-Amphora_coffeaeformis.AAC.21